MKDDRMVDGEMDRIDSYPNKIKHEHRTQSERLDWTNPLVFHTTTVLQSE